MASKTRVYAVVNRNTESMRLVKAVSQASALKHVVTDTFDVSVANSDHWERALEARTRVEEASADDEQPQLTPDGKPSLPGLPDAPADGMPVADGGAE